MKYGACEWPELRVIIDRINATKRFTAGISFALNELLGGVVHIQISVREKDDFLVILPGPLLQNTRPISRVSLQTNGLVCTVAPHDVNAAWQKTSSRNQYGALIDERRGGVIPVKSSRLCANCGVTKRLASCEGCGLVRYCSEQCQNEHWKTNHKPLCKWATACLAGSF